MKRLTFQRGADALQPLRRETAVAPEDRPAAELFGQIDPPSPLSEIAAARIRRRLEKEPDPPGRFLLPIWLKAGVGVAAALFLLETAAAAAISAWPALHDRFWAEVATHVPMPGKRRLSVEPAPAPLPLVPPAPIAPAPRIETLQLAPPASSGGNGDPPPAKQLAVASRFNSPPVRTAVRPAAVIQDEVALYSRAVSQLKVGHDPAGALGTLSVYRFKYPDGIFRGEAVISQLKAELLLGRDIEVLALLDALSAEGFAGLPQGREVGLLRVELLSRSGRCQEALGAVGSYLEPGTDPDQRERALFSRATCRAQLKDIAASREDFQTYLREFPQGRFAPQALQALNQLR